MAFCYQNTFPEPDRDSWAGEEIDGQAAVLRSPPLLPARNPVSLQV